MNNPPWVNKIILKHCDAIRAAAKKHDLPMPAMKSGCIVSDELGVGHYGAVYKTDTSGIVFKVTSDEDEAHFVATALTLANGSPSVDPEGIVRYHAIYALPETYKGRNTYVLWREEANKVGISPERTYDLVEFQKLLMRFKHLAHEAKAIADKKLKASPSTYWQWIKSQTDKHDRMIEEYNEHWGEEYSFPDDYYRSGDTILNALMRRHKGQTDRFGWLVAACASVAQEMANANGAAYLVGMALGEYLEEGILLADVHGSNVGLVDRFQYAYVITDPGHAVVLKESLSVLEIDRI